MWIMTVILFRWCTVRYSNGFLDVEFSLLSVLSNSAIIVYTISYVGVLLDFCDDESFTDGMNCSSFDKEYISFMNRYFIQYFKKSVFFDSFCKFIFADFSSVTKSSSKSGCTIAFTADSIFFSSIGRIIASNIFNSNKWFT